MLAGVRNKDVPVVFFIVLHLAMLSSARKSKTARPHASQQLPIIDLVEPEGIQYDPGAENVQPEILRQKLGSHYDDSVMSETMPQSAIQHPNGTVTLKLRKSKAGLIVPDGPLPKYIQRVDLHRIRLTDGRKVPLKIGNKLRRRFRDLLWLQTYCPLLQKWMDLGPRFWPRWFLKNSCVQKTSCSFPKGMSCRPKKATNKVLLRWHCQDWETRSQCQWLKVQYPQVTECRCSC